jgi:hypothetical protein
MCPFHFRPLYIVTPKDLNWLSYKPLFLSNHLLDIFFAIYHHAIFLTLQILTIGAFFK